MRSLHAGYALLSPDELMDVIRANSDLESTDNHLLVTTLRRVIDTLVDLCNPSQTSVENECLVLQSMIEVDFTGEKLHEMMVLFDYKISYLVLLVLALLRDVRQKQRKDKIMAGFITAFDRDATELTPQMYHHKLAEDMHSTWKDLQENHDGKLYPYMWERLYILRDMLNMDMNTYHGFRSTSFINPNDPAMNAHEHMAHLSNLNMLSAERKPEVDHPLFMTLVDSSIDDSMTSFVHNCLDFLYRQLVMRALYSEVPSDGVHRAFSGLCAWLYLTPAMMAVLWEGSRKDPELCVSVLLYMYSIRNTEQPQELEHLALFYSGFQNAFMFGRNYEKALMLDLQEHALRGQNLSTLLLSLDELLYPNEPAGPRDDREIN